MSGPKLHTYLTYLTDQAGPSSNTTEGARQKFVFVMKNVRALLDLYRHQVAEVQPAEGVELPAHPGEHQSVRRYAFLS